MMYCIYCGNKISEDSIFCPYCGKNQEFPFLMHCNNCGKLIEQDSSYCPYCGFQILRVSKKPIVAPRFINFKKVATIVKNRFFIWYILWIIVNSGLLYKSSETYSDYFNLSNVSPDSLIGNNYSKGIYPENWLYPFRNIFSGIMGQDPVYVYDISEFLIYVFLLPIIVYVCIIKREKIFRTKNRASVFYWIIWYVLLWLLILFPMGLLGLDYLGWTCTVGGLIIALYAYHNIKSKYCRL